MRGELVMALSRDQILKAEDRKKVVVSIPEWGGDVLLMEMSAKDRDEIENSINLHSGKIDYRDLKVRYAAYSIIGEDGEKLFTSEDVDALSQKSGKALDKIFKQVEKLNYFSDEELVKKSKN